MKTKSINRTLFTTAWFSVIFLCSYNSNAQKDVIELTFTAIDSSDHVQLDSIKVINRSQGSDTILYWPDTVLSLYYVGINDINKSEGAFQVFQNYPNPVADRTIISLFLPHKDRVVLQVTDLTGRVILKSERELDKGVHSFRFTPGCENLYFFSAQWRGMSKSIKIVNSVFNSSKGFALDYAGFENSSLPIKAAEDVQSFPFSLGDELLYIGYEGTLQSGIPDDPRESESYTFQFATNIACPGTPMVEYEGQAYSTIQIFSQCWLKENLNVGTTIPGSQDMANNGIIEKYCYNNTEDSCTKYGGLYQWSEMMQYNAIEGGQGICPSGWHVPTDEEWKVLEGSVDSQFGIGSSQWDMEDLQRGFDAGKNLKANWGWYNNGNGADPNGFSAVPGGNWDTYSNPPAFHNIGEWGIWWASTQSDQYSAWHRLIGDTYDRMGRYSFYKDMAFSLRCLRDY